MMDLPTMLISGVRVLGWALVHFVWQAAVVGLVYRSMRPFLPRGEARYRAGMAALCILSACPVLTVWRLLHLASPSAGAVHGMEARVLLIAFDNGVTVTRHFRLETCLPWMVLAWSGGVCLLSLRAWTQWRKLKALVSAAYALPRWQQTVDNLAKRFDLSRRVRVLCTNQLVTPVLIGWFKPVILLPMAVACNFPVAQIEMIFAHELAHMLRRDALANFLQLVIETLYFYHPVVHWISRDVRNEREICCDSLALAISGSSRHEFAAALAGLGELSERHGSLTLAANGGVLLDRVQQLIHCPTQPARFPLSARTVAMFFGAALTAVIVQIQWRETVLQQIAAPIEQIHALLHPKLKPLLSPVALIHLVNLAPARARAARSDIAMKSAAAEDPAIFPPIVERIVASVPSPEATVKIDNLVNGVDRSRASLGKPEAAGLVEKTPAPILMRKPVYPQAALIRGIEGRVVVEFTVTADGGVKDTRVVGAEPSGVFDQSALEAVRGWKYSDASGATLHRYRQTLAFSLHTTKAGDLAQSVESNDRIAARMNCQVPTGTHICRLPVGVGVGVPAASPSAPNSP